MRDESLLLLLLLLFLSRSASKAAPESRGPRDLASEWNGKRSKEVHAAALVQRKFIAAHAVGGRNVAVTGSNSCLVCLDWRRE